MGRELNKIYYIGLKVKKFKDQRAPASPSVARNPILISYSRRRGTINLNRSRGEAESRDTCKNSLVPVLC